MNAPELLEVAGISYRQLDYWTRHGYIQAESEKPGRGRWRWYTVGEAMVARRMGGLIEAGLTVEVAAEIARGDCQKVAVLLRTLAHIIDDGRGEPPAVPKEGS